MPDRAPMHLSTRRRRSDSHPWRQARRPPDPVERRRRAIFVFRPDRLHIAIDRIDLATGARTRWHDLRPSDPAGIMDIQPIFMTRDGAHYAYAYRRFISDLYIVEGLL